MIVLLGNTGYIGQAFENELQQRGCSYLGLSRRQVDYTKFEALRGVLQEHRPELVINAAGFTGKPNVDACEQNKADTLQGNVLFPLMAAQVCATLKIPFGHVSSGCIYSGARICEKGRGRVEKDLTTPAMQQLIKTHPVAIHGFVEGDEPNFTFRQPPCSFYSGSKALAEEALQGLGQVYLWRLRIPFDQFDNARNYLSKVQNYKKVYDNVNSISHRGDFVRACLELWEKRAPFGTYNVTNPGWVTTRQVIGLIESILRPARRFEFWADDVEFYQVAAKTPRSNCVLDVSKLLEAGVKMRPVEEALEDSLRNWRPLESNP